jgi:chromosome segregation ATPase
MEKMLKTMRSAVLPGLQPHIDARNEAEEQIKRLETALAGYRAKAETQEAEITALTVKAGELLVQGKDITATEKKSRDTKSDLAECVDWIERIEKELLPGAQEKLKAAERSLEAAYDAALNEEKGKIEKTINAHITNAMEEFDDFMTAERTLSSEFRVKARRYTPRIGRFVIDDGRFTRLVENTMGIFR